MVWAILFVVFFLAMLVLVALALRQSRGYPPGTHITDDGERKPGRLWTAWLHTGGHG